MTAAKQEIIQATENAPPAPVAQSESAAIFSLIARAASDPNIDIDKMERLMRMQQETREYNAKIAYATALAAAKAEITPVVRNKRNDQTKSNYADLAAISDAIDPIITKHGFSLTYDTDESPKLGHQRIICDVFHSSGHTRQHHADVPDDGAGFKGNANKTPTHAFGSTNAYGRRYLKVMIFDVATRDDNDGNRHRPPEQVPDLITEEQAAALRTALEFKGRTEADFCKVMKSDRIEALQAARFDGAMAYIKKLPAVAKEQTDA